MQRITIKLVNRDEDNPPVTEGEIIDALLALDLRDDDIDITIEEFDSDPSPSPDDDPIDDPVRGRAHLPEGYPG